MRIIGQSKNNRGMSTNIYRNRKREWIMRKKRNISKIKIAVELDQEIIIKISVHFYLLQRTAEEVLFYICI